MPSDGCWEGRRRSVLIRDPFTHLLASPCLSVLFCEMGHGPGLPRGFQSQSKWEPGVCGQAPPKGRLASDFIIFIFKNYSTDSN